MNPLLQMIHCIKLKAGVMKYDMPDRAHFDIHLSRFFLELLGCGGTSSLALPCVCFVNCRNSSNAAFTVIYFSRQRVRGKANFNRRREGIKYQVKLIYKTQSLKQAAFHRTFQKSRWIGTTIATVHSVSGCIK